MRCDRWHATHDMGQVRGCYPSLKIWALTVWEWRCFEETPDLPHSTFQLLIKKSRRLYICVVGCSVGWSLSHFCPSVCRLVGTDWLTGLIINMTLITILLIWGTFSHILGTMSHIFGTMAHIFGRLLRGPDQLDCCLILIRQVPDGSGSCLISGNLISGSAWFWNFHNSRS